MGVDFVIFWSDVFSTINIQIPIIVFIVQNQALVGTAVRWQLETNPAMFGKNVTLTCMVDKEEECNKTVTRRWDVGPHRNILLLNGHSTNSSKYYELSEEPCENFSLVIMQFDLKDVNWEYWCSFGFETSRQMLVLDERHFIGVPENNNIELTLAQKKQLQLDLKIGFYKVYPNPKCKIKIGNGDWVYETLVSNPIGIFFNSNLHYIATIDKSQCNDNITTICSVSSYTIFQWNKRLNCTDVDDNRAETQHKAISIGIVIIAVFVPLVLFVVLSSVWMQKRKRKKNTSFIPLGFDEFLIQDINSSNMNKTSSEVYNTN